MFLLMLAQVVYRAPFCTNFTVCVWRLCFIELQFNPIRPGGGGLLMPAPTLNSSQFQTI